MVILVFMKMALPYLLWSTSATRRMPTMLDMFEFSSLCVFPLANNVLVVGPTQLGDYVSFSFCNAQGNSCQFRFWEEPIC